MLEHFRTLFIEIFQFYFETYLNLWEEKIEFQFVWCSLTNGLSMIDSGWFGAKMAILPFPFGALNTALSLLLMHGISVTMFRCKYIYDFWLWTYTTFSDWFRLISISSIPKSNPTIDGGKFKGRQLSDNAEQANSQDIEFHTGRNQVHTTAIKQSK